MSLCSSRKLYLIPCVALLVLLATNSNIYIPCLPNIRDEFDSNDFITQFVIIINPLVSIVMLLLFGFLSDFYAKKSLLLISATFFMVGCLVCFFASSIKTVLEGRILQAIGDSGIAVLTQTILYKTNRKKFAYYLGIISILFGTVGIVAPILGAKILYWFGWRYNFALIFLLILPIAFFLYHSLPNKLNTKKIEQNHSLGNFLKCSSDIIKTPSFSLPNSSVVLAVGIFSTFETFSPFIYIDIFKFSPLRFSIVRGLIIFGTIIASSLYLLLLKLYTVKMTFRVGINLYRIYMLGNLLSLFNILPSSPIWVSMCLVVLSASLTFLTSSATIYALKNIKKHEGLAVSIIFISRNLASVIVPFVTSLFYERSLYPFWVISFILSLLMVGLIKLMRRIEAK